MNLRQWLLATLSSLALMAFTGCILRGVTLGLHTLDIDRAQDWLSAGVIAAITGVIALALLMVSLNPVPRAARRNIEM